MKIVTERIGAPAAPKRPARAGRAGDGVAFATMVETPSSEDAQGPAAVHPGTPADALLMAQQLPEGELGRRRNLQRGRTILAQLESLRLALIAGAIPRAQLRQLLALVELERVPAADPRLAAVLDEIELRARVELAKYGQFD